jgi:hypothetical protein
MLMKDISGSLTKSIITLLTLVIVTGCAQVSKEVDSSAIATNVSGLVLDASHKPTLIYKRANAPTLAKYSSFIIDPILVDYKDPDMKEIAVEDIAEMQDYFHKVMSEELTNAGYKVVTRSAENTLRISFLISDLKVPTAATNVSVFLVPGLQTSVGEVTVEAVFKDSLSNAINAVVVESSRGSYMFNKKPWSTWSDVESAFDNWAVGFREAVDSAHGKTH